MKHQSPAGGVIVNVGSMAGFLPSPDFPVYAAAKAGVNHFTRSLKGLWASHRIRVVGIAPSYARSMLK
jgi:NAD(P)-dependent dehydrogenase (short-subunit alcohol dehydrogenase family)